MAWLLVFGMLGLAIYATVFVVLDYRRGVATTFRGWLKTERAARPIRFKLIIAANSVTIALLWASFVTSVYIAIWKPISN